MAQQYEIEGKAQVQISELKAKATKILEQSKLTYEKDRTHMEIDRQRRLKQLEIKKAQALGDLESGKLKQFVDALGRDTLVSLARAGPDAQA